MCTDTCRHKNIKRYINDKVLENTPESHETTLTPPLSIEASVPLMETERSCICTDFCHFV